MTWMSTVEDIMTTHLFKWNPDEQSQEDIIEEARRKKYDMVPVSRNGHIEAAFYVSTCETKRITHDLLITADTQISDALAILSASLHPSLLVISQQSIKGILTPADFNKVFARSYFYGLLAKLEMLLADRAREHYPVTDRIVSILKPADKTIPQHRRTIKERSSAADRKNLGLDLVQNLLLEELECLIRQDEHFREFLGFADLNLFETLFEGVNKEFRRKVMHPTRLLLSDELGIEQLAEYVKRVIQIIDIITESGSLDGRT